MNTLSLKLFKLFFLYFLVKIASSQKSNWTCSRVESLVQIEINNYLLSDQIEVLYQFEDCRECNFLLLSSLVQNSANPNQLVGEAVLDSHYNYFFKVVQNKPDNIETICPKFLYKKLDECGHYKLIVYEKDNCTIVNTIKPNNKYIVLSYGLPIHLILIILCNLIEKYYDKSKKAFLNLFEKKNKVEDKQIEEINLDKNTKKSNASTKQRFNSLDAFRGLSLVIMIFVIYGWNTFMFLYHLPWSGVNLATIVFPWFLWIMGVSVPISINSALKKPGSNRLLLFIKVLWRSIKLFLIGLALNIPYEWSFSTIRIFGVLQRIGICYFVVACVEIIFWKKIDTSKYENHKYLKYLADFIYSWPHFVISHVFVLAWFLIVYLLPVPGCPTGYFGPGGLEYGGKYFNCTGGATGYVDKLILGLNHLYKTPTSAFIYKTEYFDPEGFVGQLTSINLAYFGTVAGRILLFYKKPMEHVILWCIWGLITFILFGALSQFDMADGLVPVNKNIWTYTFTLISASTSFFILAILYFFIDYKKWWNGNPYTYPGINSIFVYVGHTILLFRFPFNWYVTSLHKEKFLMCTYSSFLWIAVAAYMNRKKIYITV